MQLLDPAVGHFCTDYATARERFLAAATGAGARIASHRHPLSGPRGEVLACDTAWLGPEDAPRVLVLVSGAHGVEGFAGSGPQIDLLSRGLARALPTGTACLMVHGINPHGFAWWRRTTEEGVDLNRNFVDFAAALPENPGYAELADAFVTPDLEEATLQRAEARMAEYRARHGEAAYLTARGSGQYTHPGGLFHGGTAPSWSRRLTEQLIAAHAMAARAVAVVDLHTGLGPYAHGELIAGAEPESETAARLRAWYGPTLTEPQRGGSIIVPQWGMAHLGWSRLVGAGLTFAYLEFGTRPPAVMQRALCADHWLHAQGTPDWDAPLTRGIKAQMLDAYLPARDDWKEMVLARVRQVVRQALVGLSAQ
ncbi:M14 family metallopeptidase [Falsiroseomonas oryzae]|uniref:M14 family metallopeptidase n=1 Tax=Falsiroseomonas oryzae TaxID=2766473 RepID=UPI0022EB9BB0|nr:M14 family metallopeptidase [Roseomonas sp. MO-31]